MELKYNQIFAAPSQPGHLSCDKLHSEVASSCKELKEQGRDASGIYKIQPEHSSEPFMVFCDMETRGGGWTYIHNRVEGTQDFYLDWQNYKRGFGNLGGEFWLGLNYIHEITGM